MRKIESALRIMLLALSLCTLSIRHQELGAQEIHLEDKLILHLPMTGNALDVSNSNIQTKVEGPILTIDRLGKTDAAYLFNGKDDNINLNNNLALITAQEFAICMWARIDGRSQALLKSNTLFEQRDDGFGEPVVIVLTAETDGETRLVVRSSAEIDLYKAVTNYPGDGEWHFYTGMIDSEKNMQVYIDGQLKANGKLENDGNFNTGINRVNIGGHHPESKITGAFNGAIGEVHIYNRALRACEIEALYSGQLLQER